MPRLLGSARRPPPRRAQLGQKRGRVAGEAQGGGHLGPPSSQPPVEHGDEEVGLVGEVRVDGAAREPCRFGDAVEAGPTEPLCRERLFGGVEQALAGSGLGLGP